MGKTIVVKRTFKMAYCSGRKIGEIEITLLDPRVVAIWTKRMRAEHSKIGVDFRYRKEPALSAKETMQKQIVDRYNKERFNIYVFKEGVRFSSIVNCSVFDVIEEMARNLAIGDRQFVLVAETSIGSLDRINQEVWKYEEENKCRVPYMYMKKYHCIYDRGQEYWIPYFR